ncbi:MAG: hypothetical protein EPO57_05280 [Chitinophagaceae bacterium]|nr:MAG: hypothetical protein EPO57_05280 [Chitinophagaceae bacterium]
MKTNLGITGYILLIVSAAFLDVAILALLAIPVFIIGAIMVLAFYRSLINKETPKRWLAISLTTIGTILLSALAGNAGCQFISYLRGEPFGEIGYPFPSPPLSVIEIIGVNILASFIILIGIKQNSLLTNKRIYLVWIPTFLLIPLVILLIKLLKLDHVGI